MAAGGTAIVMGASVAGMWAARVLADHFERVVVLERDELPEGAAPRPGTPQARQYHVLLLRGLQLADELFPGMREELVAAGAQPFDTTGDVRLRSRGRWLEQFESGQVLLSCSRPLLEATMRRRLRQIAQVELRGACEVAGLVADERGAAVAGVRLRGAEAPILGDLIVDALGRRSSLPAWLAALGYPAPAESAVDPLLGYVTRRYRRPPGLERPWPTLLIPASPPDSPRGGLVFPEEGGAWVVMLAGACRDYPPVDEEGFLAFARSLGPELAAVVAEGEPLGRPYGYRGTESRRRHYERTARWPERLVVTGDALCSFNPIYGQGMTVAALAAVALGQALRDAGGRLDGLAAPAQRAIARASDGAWLLATGADLQWPTTERSAGGGDGPADRLARWYLAHLLEAMGDDRQVRLAFLAVNQLLAPAESLFAPPLMLRVLRARLRRR